MGKNNHKRKRPLDTSSSSSNLGETSMNNNIAEEKSDVKQKSTTQSENKEIQSTACGVISLRPGSIEGKDYSDSDEDMSNLSYNSSGNLCSSNVTEEKYFESYVESLARRRSQSLESRPRQMKNRPTSPLITKTKTLINEDCLKVISPRRLEDQRCSNQCKDGKLHQQLAHRKKRLKQIFIRVRYLITFSRLL